jgi:hypothetical protein
MNLPDYRRKVIVPVVNAGMGGGAFQLVCYGMTADMIQRNDMRVAIANRLRARGFGTEWKIVWDAIHGEQSDYHKLGWLGKRSHRFHS